MRCLVGARLWTVTVCAGHSNPQALQEQAAGKATQDELERRQKVHEVTVGPCRSTACSAV